MNIIIIIVLVLIVFLLYKKHNEKYTGAFLQLYAKGPQDLYLTGAPFHRVPYHYPYYPYYSRFNRFLWNQPTRFYGNSAPYLLLTPERYLLY